MANIIDKYFNKKKKEIYDYSRIINSLLEYNKDQIWSNDSEFNELTKSSINRYVDEYFFKSMDSFEDYTEYLGALIKCDDRFKTILVCTIDSIPEEKRIGNYKVSAYIVSLIIYTAVAINRFTYPYGRYKINVSNVYKIMDMMFKNIDFIDYKDNVKIKRELVLTLKKNAVNEKKFFEALNSLNTDTSKNMYEAVSLDNKYFKVNYKYKIEEFDKYRTKDVRKFFKRIEDDLNALSYELAALTILKAKTLNKDINLLFPASLDFYRKEAEINKLVKVTNNECIKNKIRLLVDYEDYYKNKEVVRIITNAGFELALDFNMNSDVPYRTFNEIKLALVPQEFLKTNKGNIDSWKESGVTFVIKSEVSNEISEMKLLGLEEK